jgi:hypothetical protein
MMRTMKTLLAALMLILAGCSTAGAASAPDGSMPGGSAAATGTIDPGSASTAPGTIDGFLPGALSTCSSNIFTPPPGVHTCLGDMARYEALARAALDARDPHHAAIVSFTRLTDGTQPTNDFTGGGTPVYRSPHPGPNVTVFVFKLADGSTVATGVACPETDSCVGVGAYPQ